MPAHRSVIHSNAGSSSSRSRFARHVNIASRKTNGSRRNTAFRNAAEKAILQKDRVLQRSLPLSSGSPKRSRSRGSSSSSITPSLRLNWNCKKCSLVNKPAYSSCQACGEKKNANSIEPPVPKKRHFEKPENLLPINNPPV
eukprot:UN32909